MRLRRSISLLLLAVYLFMAAGPACLSLSCECVAALWAMDRAHHGDCGAPCCACGHHGHDAFDHSNDALAAKADIASPCCDHRHSNESELYTCVSEDDHAVRCVVSTLPASMAAECPCPAHVPALRREAPVRPTPPVAAVWIPAAGFRAPPLSV